MMITSQTELMRARKRALKGHLEGTQRAPYNNVNNDNNVNNVNNIRSTDIKFLKDAYVKNKRLHQLIYNDTILKIRLFKLVLMKFLWLSIKLCVFRFLTH